jgi:uncharacterized protein (DUF342 family)
MEINTQNLYQIVAVKETGKVDIQNCIVNVDKEGVVMTPTTLYDINIFTYFSVDSEISIKLDVGDYGVYFVFKDYTEKYIDDEAHEKNINPYFKKFINTSGFFLPIWFKKKETPEFIIKSLTKINFYAPQIVIAGAPSEEEGGEPTPSEIALTGNITMKGNITMEGDVDITGNLKASGDATITGEVTGNNIKLSAHTHAYIDSVGNAATPVNKNTQKPS